VVRAGGRSIHPLELEGQAVTILEAFPLELGGPAPSGEPVPRAPSRRCGKRVAIYGDWHDTVRTPGGAPHYAQDIFAPRWWPVVSPIVGEVVDVSVSPLGGNNLTVRNRAGAWVYMAHLEQAPVVAMGQPLEVGQLLGFVGNTGSASRTCPHLHISARRSRGGERVNLHPELRELLGTWRAASRGRPTPPSVLERGPVGAPTTDPSRTAVAVAAGGGGALLLLLGLFLVGSTWQS
jgi:murein DD-endopeptidase MepM/ murein hydrolase activator NlpD